MVLFTAQLLPGYRRVWEFTADAPDKYFHSKACCFSSKSLVSVTPGIVLLRGALKGGC